MIQHKELPEINEYKEQALVGRYNNDKHRYELCYAHNVNIEQALVGMLNCYRNMSIHNLIQLRSIKDLNYSPSDNIKKPLPKGIKVHFEFINDIKAHMQEKGIRYLFIQNLSGKIRFFDAKDDRNLFINMSEALVSAYRNEEYKKFPSRIPLPQGD